MLLVCIWLIRKLSFLKCFKFCYWRRGTADRSFAERVRDSFPADGCRHLVPKLAQDSLHLSTMLYLDTAVKWEIWFHPGNAGSRLCIDCWRMLKLQSSSAKKQAGTCSPLLRVQNRRVFTLMLPAAVAWKSRRKVVYWIQHSLWHSLFAGLAIPCLSLSTLQDLSPFTALQLHMNCILEPRPLHLQWCNADSQGRWVPLGEFTLMQKHCPYLGVSPISPP